MKFKTSGVCANEINFEVEEKEGKQIVTEVKFTGGCNGNLQGISKLVEGMPVDEVIEKLQGLKCGFKATSCPDQLAKALKQLS
ncbi:TIGR03905 family TSCPD domain-containing protein [Lachnoclostridium sp.]|uniref:TIGR03905 family TSCPD domain-containing protein n=1 Tax=Lachnoclostridium sp. TaxID=2028282 RepID=UPI002897DDF2|nr:TIGR03905 family TSCPD domain-containing protein [Lachnoclostridium sp.]